MLEACTANEEQESTPAWVQTKITFFGNFEDEEKRNRIVQNPLTVEDISVPVSNAKHTKNVRDDFAFLQHSYEDLDQKTEHDAFLKMNYYKWQCWAVCQQWKESLPQHKEQTLQKQYDAAWREYERWKLAIVQCNLRTIVAAIKKTTKIVPLSRDEFTDYFQDISVTMLTKIVDKFDPERGFRFSTYVYRSAFRHIDDVRKKESRRNRLLQPDVDITKFLAPAPSTGIMCERVSQAIKDVLSTLNNREQYIITQTCGLEGEIKKGPQLANELGITKERVRQIKQEGLRKLRNKIGYDVLDMMTLANIDIEPEDNR